MDILAPVCRLAAQRTPDKVTSASYYLKIGDTDGAKTALQAATQEMMLKYDTQMAATICKLGIDNQLSQEVVLACQVATRYGADTANTDKPPDDISLT